MSEIALLQGHCLCGAVKISANDVPNAVGACHCGMCRRWGGGPFMEVDCGSGVTIEGEQHVSVFDSSEWAERAFCNSCGTHLFYRLKGTGDHMVPVGLFETDEKLVFKTQVFVDEKPPYYRFADKTREMTGAEIFAMFGSSD